MVTNYEKVFEHSKEGLLVANDKGIMEAVNPRLIELFGYSSADELLGQKVEILIPDHLRHKHIDHRKGFNDKPTNRTMGSGLNLRAKRKDGSDFQVEISLSHYKDDDGLKVIAFIVDITKRAATEAELLKLNTQLETEVQSRIKEVNEQNKLLLSIAQHFPNGNIYVINIEGEIALADGHLIRKDGLNEKSLINQSFYTQIPDLIRKDFDPLLKQLFNGEMLRFEYEHNQRHFSIYGVPINENEHSINRALLVTTDITTEKQMELEMQQNLEQERQLNEMKSRFVSMASHEFRTPLSAIVSSATLIGKYDKDSQQLNRIKHIERIKRSVSNLTTILNDFLSLDKLESGFLELKPTEIAIQLFITELLEEFNSIKKPDQYLTTQLNLEEDRLKADKVVLKNCCLNLLSNASKYSSDNGEIELNITLTKTNLMIEVKDFGIGIPAEEQKLLFSRFFRAKNVINIEGTGLGLNIVKRYIELMQGALNFESELEKGTTFKLDIPVSTS